MKFTQSHEWINLKNKTGIIGITHFAQKELGDIVYVELPAIGKTVKAGEEVVILESTKAAADVYSPVTGKILEVNELLKDKPELINQSPENEGWLYKIELESLDELDALISEETYRSKFL